MMPPIQTSCIHCYNDVSFLTLCALLLDFLWPLDSYSPPTLTGAGHHRTMSTNTGCNWWLSLAKTLLKVALAGRNRLLIARTSKCVWAIRQRTQTTKLSIFCLSFSVPCFLLPPSLLLALVVIWLPTETPSGSLASPALYWCVDRALRYV